MPAPHGSLGSLRAAFSSIRRASGVHPAVAEVAYALDGGLRGTLLLQLGRVRRDARVLLLRRVAVPLRSRVVHGHVLDVGEEVGVAGRDVP
jgi:hypothetical protein